MRMVKFTDMSVQMAAAYATPDGKTGTAMPGRPDVLQWEEL